MSKAGLNLLLADSAALFANELNRALLPDALKQILKKARFEPDSSGYQRHLLQLFSGQNISSRDLPIANLRGGSSRSLCADPCYLHPDRDQLLVFHRDLDLSPDEAHAIAGLVQPLLADFAGNLLVKNARQWLLELPARPEVEFTALEGLHGLPVTDFLPRGADAQRWIRLWNEIQMLLFDCEVNQAREAAGKVPINSLWFWGQGRLPALQPWPHVSGSGELLNTLASYSQSNMVADTDRFDFIRHKPALHILSFDPEQDWQQQLAQFQSDWLVPAWSALKKWQLRELNLIVPEWGVYCLTPISSWRLW